MKHLSATCQTQGNWISFWRTEAPADRAPPLLKPPGLALESSFKPKMSTTRFAKGPALDGSRGFTSRRPRQAAGGGGGGSAAAPASCWIAVFTEVKCYGQPATLIHAPTTFEEARAAVLTALRAEKDVEFTAAENSAWRAESIRAVHPADLNTAFPSAERPVEEHFNVGAYKKGKLHRTFYLIPQNSFMWANVKRLWAPEPEEDDDSYGDDDRGYDSDDGWRGGYSDDERYGPPGCTCDASEPPIRGRGPVFCSCRDRDDY